MIRLILGYLPWLQKNMFDNFAYANIGFALSDHSFDTGVGGNEGLSFGAGLRRAHFLGWNVGIPWSIVWKITLKTPYIIVYCGRLWVNQSM